MKNRASRIVLLSLTDAEYRQVVNNACSANMSINAYIRSILSEAGIEFSIRSEPHNKRMVNFMRDCKYRAEDNTCRFKVYSCDYEEEGKCLYSEAV